MTIRFLMRLERDSRLKISTLIILISSLVSVGDGALASGSDSFQSLNQALKFNQFPFEEVLNPQAVCGLEADPVRCDPVHSEPWCQEQFELMQRAKKLPDSPFGKSQQKRVVFVGEESEDEQAYSYYHKILSSPESGFDCLFLEFPAVFQKNFDSKEGIVQEELTLHRLDGKVLPGEVEKIKLKNRVTLDLLEDLVNTAKKNNIKVILVDSSDRILQRKSDLATSIAGRNKQIAENISRSFEEGQCHSGLSILGNLHLYGRHDSKGLEPVDSLLAKNQMALAPKDKVIIEKAVIYSPSSKKLSEAMGPCAWRNEIPQSDEVYYSGSEFFKDHEVFPESYRASISETIGGIAENNADYAIILPAQIDKPFLLDRLNRGAMKPKKIYSQESMSQEIQSLPLELRTSTTVLGVRDDAASMSENCAKACKLKNRKHVFVVDDVSYGEPTLKCQPFHPVWTGGAAYAPVLRLNANVQGTCYCTK